MDPKSVFEFSTSQKWNVSNLMEFAGKPNLLVFPKVTGRAMSIMGEEAGASSLFIFPKAIIEGCPGERSESQLKFTGWCLLYSHLICPSQSPPVDGSPHPCHQHGQGWCSPEPLSCPGRPAAQLFSPLVWHRVAPRACPRPSWRERPTAPALTIWGAGPLAPPPTAPSIWSLLLWSSPSI